MDHLPQYQVIRSDRKTIAIQITGDGQVRVRCPRRMPEGEIQAFLREKSGWIQKHLQSATAREEPFTDQQLQAFAERTGALLSSRLPAFARQLGVTYHRVTIRRQRTRWGSCSSQGNLNFNCLLALVPAEVLDYVVVHELCHLKQMNHSPKFWAEVAAILPDYKAPRMWLKEHGRKLIYRLWAP